MSGRVFIPLVDLCFLSLGAIVAILSQTQIIKSLPIELAEIAPGIAAISRDEMTVVTIHDGVIEVKGRSVALDNLLSAMDTDLALLRVDHDEPTEHLVQVMSVLASGEIELRLEVTERTHRSAGRPEPSS